MMSIETDNQLLEALPDKKITGIDLHVTSVTCHGWWPGKDTKESKLLNN